MTRDPHRALRLAIVGGGPRGLFALESLLIACQPQKRPGALTLRVDVFEDREVPGTGPNYALDQPSYLRMNFAAKHITVGPESGQPSLVQWLGRRHPAWADDEACVPRALVGGYLSETYSRVVEALAERGVDVRHRRQRVVDISPEDIRPQDIRSSGRGWRLGWDPGENDAASGREWFETYDHVLLTTGHDSSRASDFAERWRDCVDVVIDRVYPVDSWLAAGRIPAGGLVAVRGFALTFIDAALALTEGRGGRFEPMATGGYRHQPSTEAVKRIVPFSRTGRPLLAKPDARRVRAPRQLDDLWTSGRERIGNVDALAGLHDVLRDFATRALERAWKERHGESSPISAAAQVAAAQVAEMLDSLLAGHQAHDALERMRASVAVATGRAEVDAPWALGEAWRQLYPAIVRRVGQGGLAPDERQGFARLGAEMERLAFGPPVGNLAKIMALCDAGVVDTRWLRTPQLRAIDGRLELRSVRAESRAADTLAADTLVVDALVDAVMPAPGCDHRSPLLGSLMARGLARPYAETSGLDVDQQGRPVGADGRPSASLAVIGRAAEGCIIGHDTLSRRLHPHLDRWAADIYRLTAKRVLP